MLYLIYNAASPPIYLDLGSALAASGLIFAAYQFREPQWALVLRIREGWQKNLVWIFGGLGLLLVLFRVLIFEFHGPEFLQFPFNAPLFYEILAYLFFVASPLSLIFFSTQIKGLFTEKTARKFYEELVREISKNNDEKTEAALEVLLWNFKAICIAAKEQRKPKEINLAATTILFEVLSDESIVKILATKKLDALLHIFETIKEFDINQRTSGTGVAKIVQRMFLDEESFLYKQLDGSGIARSLSSYESIFGSSVILKNFELFNYSGRSLALNKDLSGPYLDVYIKALLKAISTYLKAGGVPPRHINEGISHLGSIFAEMCTKISIEEKRGLDTKYALKNEWDALSRIAFFVEHEYIFLDEPDYPGGQKTINSHVAEAEKTTSEADFRSNSTINAGISGLIYKALEQLSYIANTLDTHHLIIALLEGMQSHSEYKEGYRRPFEKILWEKIAANVIRRHYPAILRVYLQLIGFCLIQKTQRTGWLGDQAERMRRLLYVDLKPLLDQDAEMADKHKMKDVLLASSMSYKEGVFTYTTQFGRGTEMTISPPPEGSGSALEGVDLDASTHLF